MNVKPHSRGENGNQKLNESIAAWRSANAGKGPEAAIFRIMTSRPCFSATRLRLL